MDDCHLFLVWPQRVEVHPSDTSHSPHFRCESSHGIFQIERSRESVQRSRRLLEIASDCVETPPSAASPPTPRYPLLYRVPLQPSGFRDGLPAVPRARRW